MLKFKKALLSLAMLFLLPNISLAEGPTVEVINNTSCLYNMDTHQASKVQPITAYFFVGTNDDLTYSGVSIAGGQTGTAPLGVITTPASTPALLIGTSPNDSPSHISAMLNPTNIVSVSQVILSWQCPATNPCIMIVPGGCNVD